MSQIDFNKLNLDQKAALVFMSGEYVSAIRYYGFRINLYVFKGYYIEVFYNVHNNEIEQIELLEPVENRLHLYTTDVDLNDLFK